MAAMARKRSNTRSRDMVISMGVLLVPLLLIMWFFTVNPEETAEAIDLDPYLEQAESADAYPVLRAEALPEEWVPVRAAWAADGERWLDGEAADGNSWQVGYMGPDDIYYGVEQRDRSAPRAIADLTRDGEATGDTIEAVGWTWERYESEDGRTKSLVATEGDMVAVVSADTGFDALEAFTTSLATD